MKAGAAGIVLALALTAVVGWPAVATLREAWVESEGIGVGGEIANDWSGIGIGSVVDNNTGDARRTEANLCGFQTTETRTKKGRGIRAGVTC